MATRKETTPDRKKEKRKLPLLPPYERPADDQIVVWVEDQGKPFVLGIFDELIQPSSETRHNSYREFVQLVRPAYAETAVRLYQMEHEQDDGGGPR